ncbi:MAG: helix-turn-helix domain-containing protein [Stenomitos frigidus ULC029]
MTFTKPPAIYRVQCINDTLQWNSEFIRALRLHMGLNQSAMAKELGVRQQTVSEWEKGIYTPTRASSKQLTLVAEKAAFRYEVYEAGYASTLQRSPRSRFMKALATE